MSNVFLTGNTRSGSSSEDSGLSGYKYINNTR